MGRNPVTRLGRRGGTAAVTGLLAVAGATCLGVAACGQDHPPQAPLASSAAPSPTAAPVKKRAPRAVPAVVGTILPTSTPVSISIPAIGVTSTLLQLGVTSTGELEVPAAGPDYDRAGWYRYSPTPGAQGPAVIAGHVDSAEAGPSVFYRLGSLHAKDQVSITRADGSVATFSVDDVQRFPKAEFPTQLVYGNTTNAALRLITCGGDFDSATGHYRDNVVVRASLVSGTAATTS